MFMVVDHPLGLHMFQDGQEYHVVLGERRRGEGRGRGGEGRGGGEEGERRGGEGRGRGGGEEGRERRGEICRQLQYIAYESTHVYTCIYIDSHCPVCVCT